MRSEIRSAFVTKGWTRISRESLYKEGLLSFHKWQIAQTFKVHWLVLQWLYLKLQGKLRIIAYTPFPNGRRQPKEKHIETSIELAGLSCQHQIPKLSQRYSFFQLKLGRISPCFSNRFHVRDRYNLLFSIQTALCKPWFIFRLVIHHAKTCSFA